MPETITRPVSRTEIRQRVRGTMLAGFSVQGWIRDDASFRAHGFAPRGVRLLVAELAEAFSIEIEELADEQRFEAFAQSGTVGQLCDLIEGALGGIRS